MTEHQRSYAQIEEESYNVGKGHTDDAAEFHAEPHRPKPGAEPNRDYQAHAAANYQTVDQSDQSFFSHNSTRGIPAYFAEPYAPDYDSHRLSRGVAAHRRHNGNQDSEPYRAFDGCHVILDDRDGYQRCAERQQK